MNLHVVLAYNLKRVKPERGGAHDEEAEFDSPSTIDAIARAIEANGHVVTKVEADAGFPATVLALQPDLVFNVAEGSRGRSREAHVPAFLELVGIPYTGSDPSALVTTLDKAVAKSIVRAAGVRTPQAVVMTNGAEPLPPGFLFPAIVKPVAEGSSKGVLPSSVATTEREARSLARRMAARYPEGALVEEYLPGREFTVAIVGEPALVLPPMEVILQTGEKFPVYSFDHKLEPTDEVRYESPAKVSPELDMALRQLALASFTALGCRDVARVDVRLDAEGRPSFIECNPLPGLTPGWSDLCLIAAPAGIDYEALIGRILAPAIARRREEKGLSLAS